MKIKLFHSQKYQLDLLKEGIEIPSSTIIDFDPSQFSSNEPLLSFLSDNLSKSFTESYDFVLKGEIRAHNLETLPSGIDILIKARDKKISDAIKFNDKEISNWEKNNMLLSLHNSALYFNTYSIRRYLMEPLTALQENRLQTLEKKVIPVLEKIQAKTKKENELKQKKLESKRKLEEQKRLKKEESINKKWAHLKKWALENGSSITKDRINLNFSWKRLAVTDYANFLIPYDFHLTSVYDDDYSTYYHKNPSSEEMEIIKKFNSLLNDDILNLLCDFYPIGFTSNQYAEYADDFKGIEFKVGLPTTFLYFTITS